MAIASFWSTFGLILFLQLFFAVSYQQVPTTNSVDQPLDHMQASGKTQEFQSCTEMPNGCLDDDTHFRKAIADLIDSNKLDLNAEDTKNDRNDILQYEPQSVKEQSDIPEDESQESNSGLGWNKDSQTGDSGIILDKQSSDSKLSEQVDKSQLQTDDRDNFRDSDSRTKADSVIRLDTIGMQQNMFSNEALERLERQTRERKEKISRMKVNFNQGLKSEKVVHQASLGHENPPPLNKRTKEEQVRIAKQNLMQLNSKDLLKEDIGLKEASVSPKQADRRDLSHSSIDHNKSPLSEEQAPQKMQIDQTKAESLVTKQVQGKIVEPSPAMRKNHSFRKRTISSAIISAQKKKKYQGSKKSAKTLIYASPVRTPIPYSLNKETEPNFNEIKLDNVPAQGSKIKQFSQTDGAPDKLTKVQQMKLKQAMGTHEPKGKTTKPGAYQVGSKKEVIEQARRNLQKQTFGEVKPDNQQPKKESNGNETMADEKTTLSDKTTDSEGSLQRIGTKLQMVGANIIPTGVKDKNVQQLDGSLAKMQQMKVRMANSQKKNQQKISATKKMATKRQSVQQAKNLAQQQLSDNMGNNLPNLKQDELPTIPDTKTGTDKQIDLNKDSDVIVEEEKFSNIGATQGQSGSEEKLDTTQPRKAGVNIATPSPSHVNQDVNHRNVIKPRQNILTMPKSTIAQNKANEISQEAEKTAQIDEPKRAIENEDETEQLKKQSGTMQGKDQLGSDADTKVPVVEPDVKPNDNLLSDSKTEQQNIPNVVPGMPHVKHTTSEKATKMHQNAHGKAVPTIVPKSQSKTAKVVRKLQPIVKIPTTPKTGSKLQQEGESTAIPNSVPKLDVQSIPRAVPNVPESVPKVQSKGKFKPLNLPKAVPKAESITQSKTENKQDAAMDSSHAPSPKQPVVKNEPHKQPEEQPTKTLPKVELKAKTTNIPKTAKSNSIPVQAKQKDPVTKQHHSAKVQKQKPLIPTKTINQPKLKTPTPINPSEQASSSDMSKEATEGPQSESKEEIPQTKPGNTQGTNDGHPTKELPKTTKQTSRNTTPPEVNQEMFNDDTDSDEGVPDNGFGFFTDEDGYQQTVKMLQDLKPKIDPTSGSSGSVEEDLDKILLRSRCSSWIDVSRFFNNLKDFTQYVGKAGQLCLGAVFKGTKKDLEECQEKIGMNFQMSVMVSALVANAVIAGTITIWMVVSRLQMYFGAVDAVGKVQKRAPPTMEAIQKATGSLTAGYVGSDGYIPAFVDARIGTDLCVLTLSLRARLKAEKLMSHITHTDYTLREALKATEFTIECQDDVHELPAARMFLIVLQHNKKYMVLDDEDGKRGLKFHTVNSLVNRGADVLILYTGDKESHMLRLGTLYNERSVEAINSNFLVRTLCRKNRFLTINKLFTVTQEVHLVQWIRQGLNAERFAQ